MEKLLQGIPGVMVYIDDILITGNNEVEHLSNLKEVLNWLRQSGLRLKLAKCNFMVFSVSIWAILLTKVWVTPFNSESSCYPGSPTSQKCRGAPSLLEVDQLLWKV